MSLKKGAHFGGNILEIKKIKKNICQPHLTLAAQKVRELRQIKTALESKAPIINQPCISR